jgi:hypothetical protein
MEVPNADLSIEFVSLSGEVLHKTSNLEDLSCLYYSWIKKFGVKLIHTHIYSDLEEINVFYSDTAFSFDGIIFNSFSSLTYYILTNSTIGAINIVTVIKSSKKIYQFKNRYEDDSLRFGISSYIERL